MRGKVWVPLILFTIGFNRQKILFAFYDLMQGSNKRDIINHTDQKELKETENTEMKARLAFFIQSVNFTLYI